ncbi:MAG: FlgK family flagellar hook-associated protein [Eubacteriales bacterium]
MPGSFFGLEISRRGLQVHRNAMDITNHNIANASTPGYSRQEGVIEASDPWTLPDLTTRMQPGQLGTGVITDSIRRIRDNYLDSQYRQSSSFEGYWEKKLDVIKRAEALFPEPDGRGVQAELLNFFNDWQDLNNNPQDIGVKKALAESGDELAGIFRQLYSQLKDIGSSIMAQDTVESPPGYIKIVSGEMSDQVDQANQLLTRIADLSNTITRLIVNGAQPNDLMDQRDNLLDELSKLGRLDVETEENGAVTVKLIGGNTDATVLSADASGKTIASRIDIYNGVADGDNYLFIDGVQALNLTDLADSSAATYTGASQGSILGLESSRLENVDIMDQIDSLAQAIIGNVNDKAGITFFSGAGAADMALDVNVKNDPNLIVGENALAVAQLRSTQVLIGAVNVTFESYYQGIVAGVGGKTDHYTNMLENQQAIAQQLTSMKQSVSGVSVDEELSKVIQYQYGYQASAKMLGVQDEMLDYLINRMR